MKLTKYEHACFTLEESGKKVVIDPGMYTQSLGDVSNVVALVITHEHPDHCEPRMIEQITRANPDVLIFVPEGLDLELETDAVVYAVKAGDKHEVDPFTLEFFGAKHAQIHASVPRPNNIGVLVNGTVYYPGDSFDLPGKAHPKVLLTPTSGPWLKIGEAMDFVTTAQPQLCVPTHNALYSEIGNSSADRWIQEACTKCKATFNHLTPGEDVDC